jgi:hypothetical protein
MSQAGTVYDTDDEDGPSVGPSNALPVNPAMVEPTALLEPEPEQAQPQSGAQMSDAAAVAKPELGQARSQGSASSSMQSANLPKRSTRNPHPMYAAHLGQVDWSQPLSTQSIQGSIGECTATGKRTRTGSGERIGEHGRKSVVLDSMQHSASVGTLGVPRNA